VKVTFGFVLRASLHELNLLLAQADPPVTAMTVRRRRIYKEHRVHCDKGAVNATRRLDTRSPG
jgi:hypothetical protein